jgi:hypothetical protein
MTDWPMQAGKDACAPRTFALAFSDEEKICAAKEQFSVSAFLFLRLRLRKLKLPARIRRPLTLSVALHG